MAAETRTSARKRGYDGRWQKARATFLAHHPHCTMCTKAGQTVAATVVDHIEPHRGDQAKFWDKANWQPLCAPHHNSTKQRAERGRGSQAVGVDGWPIE